MNNKNKSSYYTATLGGNMYSKLSLKLTDFDSKISDYITFDPYPFRFGKLNNLLYKINDAYGYDFSALMSHEMIESHIKSVKLNRRIEIGRKSRNTISLLAKSIQGFNIPVTVTFQISSINYYYGFWGIERTLLSLRINSFPYLNKIFTRHGLLFIRYNGVLNVNIVHNPRIQITKSESLISSEEYFKSLIATYVNESISNMIKPNDLPTL